MNVCNGILGYPPTKCGIDVAFTVLAFSFDFTHFMIFFSLLGLIGLCLSKLMVIGSLYGSFMLTGYEFGIACEIRINIWLQMIFVVEYVILYVVEFLEFPRPLGTNYY